MATTNVKILLRRGFRNEIGNDTLDTGEMGFATDTNQLYVGIDKAIDEIRFDPFVNAQAVIQSWLDSADNTVQPGLKIDEDLVIRQVTDVDALLDAMNFFVQTITFDTTTTTFTNGHTLNQKYNKELSDPAEYVIYETGEILSSTVDSVNNTTAVTVKISEAGRFDEVGQFYTPGGFRQVTDVTKTLTADINDTNDPLITPVSSVEISDPVTLPDDYYIPETIDVNNGVDAEYQLTRANGDYTYTYNSTSKTWTITFATPIVDGKVQQEQISATTTITGNGAEAQFNLGTYPDPAPSSVVVKDSGGNVLTTPADYEIYDQNHANYNGIVEEIVFTTAPTGVITIEYNEEVDVDENARVDTLKVNFSDNGAFIYETVDTSDVATDLSALTTTGITGGSEFRVSRYAGARRNVEVVTENSFNQMFADQHLQALDASTGLRSSLYNKELKQRQHTPDMLEAGLEYKILVVGTNTDAQDNWNTVAGTTGVTYAVGDTFTAVATVTAETGQGSAITNQGVFLKYPKDDCTSFFIDYSLKQSDTNNTYVRVGQIKAINCVPQGINKVKLSDDNTENWQDDGDNIAEADEFSNINFTAEIVGTDIIFKFTQDYDFETNISYTVKRWTM